MDFRGHLDNSEESILQTVKDVITEAVPEDGIIFNPGTIDVERSQIDADDEGVRVNLTVHLGRARIPMQLDIGFSDVFVSRADRVDYPTLLSGTKIPRLKSYLKESMVSEKFHAMIRRAELISRFKDYYDIGLLTENFEFNSQPLQKAI